MLLREEVTVFEPLWTLIPSNKAILPLRVVPDDTFLAGFSEADDSKG